MTTQLPIRYGCYSHFFYLLNTPFAWGDELHLLYFLVELFRYSAAIIQIRRRKCYGRFFIFRASIRALSASVLLGLSSTTL